MKYKTVLTIIFYKFSFFYSAKYYYSDGLDLFLTRTTSILTLGRYFRINTFTFLEQYSSDLVKIRLILPAIHYLSATKVTHRIKWDKMFFFVKILAHVKSSNLTISVHNGHEPVFCGKCEMVLKDFLIVDIIRRFFIFLFNWFCVDFIRI